MTPDRPSDVDPESARRIADALVARHARMSREPTPRFDPRDVARRAQEAALAIEKRAPDWAADEPGQAACEQASFFESHADWLLARAADGRIAPGLEPLRLRDVALAADGTAHIDAPAVADGPPADLCVELAGLTVDLLAAGAADTAERLVSHYAGEAGDFELYRVLDFYERGCALERAADTLRHDAGSAGRAAARRLVLLALSSAREAVVPAVVVAVGGAVASGKSTLARALADRMGAPRVVADRVAAQLRHGTPDRAIHEADWGQAFDRRFHDRVYGELLRRADRALAAGRPVVVDGCFALARDRTAARSVARRHGVPFLWVECRIDRATQCARLEARDEGDARGGWRALADALDQAWESASEIDPAEREIVDTERSLEAALARLESRIPSWPRKPRKPREPRKAGG